ncbi:MAG: hypothetical protein IID33_14905 [Planctomycetes bacterium]|nr:hypothetical protein [Planctomycetota bacterium]
MRRFTYAIAIATVLAAASTSGAAALQDAKKTSAAGASQKADQVIEIISLEHTEANSVVRIVQNIIGSRVVADSRTNSLIISGTTEIVARVKTLVAQLDIEVRAAANTDRQTRYFETTLPIDGSTLKLVHSIISKGTRIAADGKMLVVQGSQQDLAEVAALVKKLNETAATRKSPIESASPRSIQTNFYFISMSLVKGASTKGAAPLPAALKPVADALAENGFYSPSLLAPLFVNAKEVSRGDNFQISGQAGDIKIRVRGSVGQSGSPDSVEMSVTAELTVPKFVEGISSKGVKFRQRSGSQSLFDIETRLNVKLGDYVVLAAAPSSFGDGRAIALVVRATLGD